MHLLKIEWQKLKPYRTFWILIAIYVILFFVWNIGTNRVTNAMSSSSVNLNRESYAFPYVWNIVAYIYRWFIFILCMFVMISVCNEYTFKTQRQHIIDGMNRLDFLHAKVQLVVVTSLIATIFYALVCLLFGLINGGSGPFEQIQMIPYVFIFTLNYLSFSALIAFYLKRTGLSIILFLGYLMLESGFTLLINLKLKTFAGNLLPTQCADELLPLRTLDTLKNLAGDALKMSETSIYTYLVMSVAYVILYYFLVRRRMLVADL